MNIEMGWFGKSILAAFLFIVPFLSVNFFVRNFQLKPEVILIWYFVGLAIGSFGLLISFKLVKLSELSPTIPLIAVAILGLVFGSLPNILLYQALPMSPNPGLPMAIINIATVITFLAAIGLAQILPKWFVTGKFDWVHLCGIALTVIGVSLVALRR